jgi:hypothetical protein
MVSIILKMVILIQVSCFATGLLGPSDSLRSKECQIHDVNGVEYFSISTAAFFGVPDTMHSKSTTRDQSRKSLIEILKSGNEYSIGSIVPTSFAVVHDLLFIPSVPTNEIISFGKNGDRVKSYELHCTEACSPNYFSFLQKGTFLINTWNTSILREVDTANGQVLALTRACSLKNWVRDDDFILCEKGLHWRDNQGLFSNQKKLNRPLSEFFDYYFLDSTLVVSLFLDDDTNVLMYQSINSRHDSRPYSILLPIKMNEYQAVHIIDGNESQLRFLLLSSDFRKDMLVQLNVCNKSVSVTRLNTKYDGVPFIGEAAAIWPGGVVYSASNGNLYSLTTDKDSIKVYKFEIDVLSTQSKDCKP